ncbi:MAG: secretin N-terminal domain-containing protein [Verrucomicrobiales bacterium]
MADEHDEDYSYLDEGKRSPCYSPTGAGVSPAEGGVTVIAGGVHSNPGDGLDCSRRLGHRLSKKNSYRRMTLKRLAGRRRKRDRPGVSVAAQRKLGSWFKLINVLPVIIAVAAVAATPVAAPPSVAPQSSEKKYLKDYVAVTSDTEMVQAYRPGEISPERVPPMMEEVADQALETLGLAEAEALLDKALALEPSPPVVADQVPSSVAKADAPAQATDSGSLVLEDEAHPVSEAESMADAAPESGGQTAPEKDVASVPVGKPDPAVETPIKITPELIDQPSAGLLADDGLPDWAIGLHTNSAGDQLYSFRASDLDIQEALALFARAYKLNIVPDPDVRGSITVDLHNLPLEQVMEAFLSAHGFHWEEANELIRVHRMQTEIFTIDYPRMVRTGDGYSSASLGGGGSSGGAGGGGGGSGGGGAGGGGGASGGGGTNITQQDSIDFWTELETQLKSIASKDGKLMIDKMSGILQVTERPDVLKNISEFLAKMQRRVRRQVDIEAKIYEVTLNRQFQLGVDWSLIIERADLDLLSGIDGMTSVRNPMGGAIPRDPSIIASLVKNDRNGQLSATINALQEQGNVKAVSQPRLRSLNNQMAVIKVGTEQPFFSSNSGFITGTTAAPGGTFENTSFEMITVGTILSITPQISDDDQITLDVSPVITSLVGTESAGGNSVTTAPVLDVKQSSSLVRVHDGETIVIAGLIQEKTTRSVKGIPVLGSIPLLGRAFRGNTDTKSQTELVIFLTPTIIE